MSAFVTDYDMLHLYQKKSIKQGKLLEYYPISLAIASKAFGISKQNAG